MNVHGHPVEITDEEKAALDAKYPGFKGHPSELWRGDVVVTGWSKGWYASCREDLFSSQGSTPVEAVDRLVDRILRDLQDAVAATQEFPEVFVENS